MKENSNAKVQKNSDRKTYKGRKSRIWTSEMIEKLRRDYETNTLAQIAEKYGKNKDAVRITANYYGIRKRGPYKCFKWTEEKNKLISELYDKYTNKEIAEIIGVSKTCLDIHAQYIGLRKSKEYRKRISKENAINNNNIDHAFLSDKNIARTLSGASIRDKERKKKETAMYLEYPELIELKRNQILLNREIKKVQNG
ncbi:MAG: hypothetical protein FWF53_05660 [Candidatus Azobacteroides sp.]|nr:hypothetical protein [Candidatus Azobacteroides sp.]